MKESMKCPFRMDKHLEFKDCYGKACMAYAEYEDTCKGEAVARRTCLRLNFQPSNNYIKK